MPLTKPQYYCVLFGPLISSLTFNIHYRDLILEIIIQCQQHMNVLTKKNKTIKPLYF